MNPRGTRARRARRAPRTVWLAAGAVVLAGTGVTAVAVTGGSGNTGGDDNSRPVKAHTLALDGKDPKKRELGRTETQLFSLVGVSWEDSLDDFEGTAQIRTRAADGGAWSEWRDLEFDVRAPETGEGSASGVRGASEPLWVGASDAVEARVVAGGEETAVPDALRLDMIDPGVAGKDATQTVKPGRGVVQPQRTTTRKPTPTPTPAPSTTPATTEPGTPAATPTGGSGGTSSPPPSPSLEPTPSSPPESSDPSLPGPSTAPTTAEPGDSSPPAPSFEPSPPPPSPSEDPAVPTASTEPTPPPAGSPEPSPTQTSVEPSSDPEPGTSPSTTATTPSVPPIVSRAAWGADESLVADPPSYLSKVDAVFVHHTAGTNSYDCAESPAIIRAILTYHVKTNGWNDIGYNFFVDKCGTVFEGRAGGVDKPVRGAHTYGFNGYSSGVSLLGDYENGGTPTPAAKQAIADIAAWKLGLHGVDPEAKVTLTAAGDTGVYKNGEQATLNTVSGHRDGFATLCPGATLYSALPEIRRTAGSSVYAH
ncbi:peptidoglycan recognition protein [Streptomyces sp. NPDC006540]|uniref:peptidoglycan recognition protein family protein n=1 Tax=Streptomyces sp. NPDC006540 TaxID=3155353 RepID=UPI0033A3B3DD